MRRLMQANQLHEESVKWLKAQNEALLKQRKVYSDQHPNAAGLEASDEKQVMTAEAVKEKYRTIMNQWTALKKSMNQSQEPWAAPASFITLLLFFLIGSTVVCMEGYERIVGTASAQNPCEMTFSQPYYVPVHVFPSNSTRHKLGGRNAVNQSTDVKMTGAAGKL